MYNLESLYHYCIIGMPTYSYFLLGINNVLTLYKVVQKNHCFFVIQSECKIGMTPLFTFNNMSSLFTVGLHIFSLGPKINFSNLNSRANSCNWNLSSSILWVLKIIYQITYIFLFNLNFLNFQNPYHLRKL